MKGGGAGGSRTLVQTGKPYAFYTLIPDFGFRVPTRPGPPIDTLAPKFHPCIGAYRDYFRFNLRRLILRFGTTSLERRLVSPPCREIKLAIYYTSIKQRERTLFRQLIFSQLRLWREPRSLRVLTYHLNPLSNPVNPRYRKRISVANIQNSRQSPKIFHIFSPKKPASQGCGLVIMIIFNI